ncbi:hypothetical protein [Nostoc mirabile]|uniref:hypothetical protein n=1 Tax=Nostoc mirabile TaxID=2907820 RepID=UPI0035575817
MAEPLVEKRAEGNHGSRGLYHPVLRSPIPLNLSYLRAMLYKLIENQDLVAYVLCQLQSLGTLSIDLG